MTSQFVIAVDGPSGTGKSTVSRQIARQLGAGYLDTGALYRMVTVHMLGAGIDANDTDAVTASLADIRIDPPTDPDDQRQLLGGVDVTEAIRQPEVTAHVSAVAANPAVRAFLLDLQRKLANSGRMVVEGRDVGTVITPDAPVKIYLTADATVRAQRRQAQDAESGTKQQVDSVEADLQRRDQADSSRKAAPLVTAPDAVIVDSTHLTIAETVAAVLDAVTAKGIA